MTSNADDFSLKLLERIHKELKEIEAACLDYQTKDKLIRLIDLLEKGTIKNKAVLLEMIYTRIKETKGRNPELNTKFYLLYRKLDEDKISTQEAQSMYDMYAKESDNLWLL